MAAIAARVSVTMHAHTLTAIFAIATGVSVRDRALTKKMWKGCVFRPCAQKFVIKGREDCAATMAAAGPFPRRYSLADEAIGSPIPGGERGRALAMQGIAHEEKGT